MARDGWRDGLKRYGAPAAFLAAVTVAVLLVRSGLETHSAPGTTVATTSTRPGPARASVRHRLARYYRLRAGETISDVAIRFHKSVGRLLALNPGIKPKALVIGQRIRVG